MKQLIKIPCFNYVRTNLATLDPLLQTIRSLRSGFRLLIQDSEKLELAFVRAIAGGIGGTFIFEFAVPERPWVTEWNTANSNWINRPDLVMPSEGLITEAFIKPAGNKYALSFSDQGTPLVRWGFYAKSVLTHPA